MSKELAKTYDPKGIEERLYETRSLWIDQINRNFFIIDHFQRVD